MEEKEQSSTEHRAIKSFQQGQTTDSSERQSHFAREDSGKGTSVSSADFGDETNGVGEQIPDSSTQEMPDKDIVPPVIAELQQTPQFLNDNWSSNVSFHLHQLRNNTEQQNDDSSQGCIDLSQNPSLNISSFVNDKPLALIKQLANDNEAAGFGPPALSDESASSSSADIFDNASMCSPTHGTRGANSKTTYHTMANRIHENYDDSTKASDDQHTTEHKCTSAPSVSGKTPTHVNGFSSFSFSPVDLVPKHIMDTLCKELERERFLGKLLHLNNLQLQEQNRELFQRVDSVEREMARIIDYANQQNENAVMMQRQVNSWKEKCNKREENIRIKDQEIEKLLEQCKHLQTENGDLNKKLGQEQTEKHKLKVRMKNLESSLEGERTRFQRDERCLKEKMKKLEEENKWLREGFEADGGLPKHSAVQSESNNGAHETQLKEVTSERATISNGNTHNMQGARPKQPSPNSDNHAFHQEMGVKPKLAMKASDTVKNNTLTSEEQCNYCYKTASEFNSLKDFLEHIRKCGD